MLSQEGFIETPEKSGFIPFLLDNSDPLLQKTLLPGDFEAIRWSLYSAGIRQCPPCLFNQFRAEESIGTTFRLLRA